jgi:hypothetical protein
LALFYKQQGDVGSSITIGQVRKPSIGQFGQFLSAPALSAAVD